MNNFWVLVSTTLVIFYRFLGIAIIPSYIFQTFCLKFPALFEEYFLCTLADLTLTGILITDLAGTVKSSTTVQTLHIILSAVGKFEKKTRSADIHIWDSLIQSFWQIIQLFLSWLFSLWYQALPWDWAPEPGFCWEPWPPPLDEPCPQPAPLCPPPQPREDPWPAPWDSLRAESSALISIIHLSRTAETAIPCCLEQNSPRCQGSIFWFDHLSNRRFQPCQQTAS